MCEVAFVLRRRQATARVCAISRRAIGRTYLRALVAGETDPGRPAELALGRLRKQLPRLRPALTGRVTETTASS